MPETKSVGQYLAESIPVRDDECESDLMPLADIVVTGIEIVPWTHFYVTNYRPDASGDTDHPWATIAPLDDVQDPQPEPLALTADVVRAAVAAYADKRIAGGMSLEDVRDFIDGSYLDASIADSILQLALYGEELLN